MKKKCLAIGIILLFIGTGIIPAIAQNTKKTLPASRGNWLYVGGSGPENYTTIQDAINTASDGDTVFVFDDASPYYEHVVIPKSLSLIGENKETTIIDGNGSDVVVLLRESFITLQGFTVTDGYEGIEIQSTIHILTNCTITDNIVHKNVRYGIIIDGGNNNTVLGNTIKENNNSGIALTLSYYNFIKNNIVQYNHDGITLYELGDFNTISGNILSNNNNTSIFLYASHHNIIEGNDIEMLALVSGGGSIIRKNNFFGHINHVYCAGSGSTKWDANYWDNWIGLKWNGPITQKLPKIIICYLLPFPMVEPNVPYFKFDWHPVKELYNIPR